MYATKLEDVSNGGFASLGKLFQQGFPVPPGFVLTKEAHQKFLAFNSSKQETQLPEDILSELRNKYEELSVGKELKELGGRALEMVKTGREAFVAVRGEGVSHLNVRGFQQLQQAVKEVWSHSPGELIIQKMVHAETSGVLFPHPVDEATVIESCWGLCLQEEGNDLSVIDKEGNVHQSIGQKEWFMTRDPLTDKTIRQNVLEEKRGAATLTEENVRALYKLEKQAVDLLGGKVTIDFAFERNRPYLIQVHPSQKKDVPPPDIPLEAEHVASGEVIVPGSVRGRVKHVHSPEESGKVEVGDILVAESFRKEFLKTNCSGMILRKGSLHFIGTVATIPTLRSNVTLQDGEDVLLDAVKGEVYRIKPAESAPEPVLSSARPSIKASVSSVGNIPDVEGIVLRAETLLTEGGKHPTILAIESPDETTQLIESSLEGIARKLFPKPLWYRSFEGRTDEMQGLEGAEEREANPLLGWRGIRRALEDSVFRCELEALQKLYDKGLHNIFLILPFVSTIEELKKAKQLISFPLKIGIMIETPAAALEIEQFCREGIFAVQMDLDALTQLALGMDADNPRFSSFFSSLSPAVKQLVKGVLETCKHYRIEVSVQGEACNSPATLPLLEGASIITDTDNVENMRRMLQG